MKSGKDSRIKALVGEMGSQALAPQGAGQGSGTRSVLEKNDSVELGRRISWGLKSRGGYPSSAAQRCEKREDCWKRKKGIAESPGERWVII